jgi:hypothetical protein
MVDIPRRTEQIVREALSRQAAVALLGPCQVGKPMLPLATYETTASLFQDPGTADHVQRNTHSPKIGVIRAIGGRID